MKLGKILLLLSIVGYFQTPVSGQVKASFKADTTKGCGETIIRFTNKSSPSDSIRWFMGINGITIKDSATVSLSYPPGTYQIKLIAYNHLFSPASDTSVIKINIYNPPVAAFKVNRVKACLPDSAKFTDESIKGDGTITSWYWDFRDGTISTLENPTRIYPSAGTYSVYLKVTDSNNCFNELTQTNYISVAKYPVAGFSASPAGGCTAPLNVSFNNSSTGPGTLDYTWNFGNGQISYLQSPSTTFTALGSYKVTLIVNSTDYGCSTTLAVPSAVVIGNVQASGTLIQNDSVITNKSIICPGPVNFSSTSTGASSVLWNFGDTTSSTSINGVHQYQHAGSYTVTLIASSGSKCSDTLTWNFTIEKVVAGFIENPNNSCSSSPIVDTFKNQSYNAVSYLWTFADGSTSTAENPTFKFTPPVDKNPYVIHTAQNYNTTLTVKSLHNCPSSVTHTFTILRPTALFTIDTSQGCVPLKVTLTSQSISQSPISFFRWQCGDGKDTLTLTNSYAHTFSGTGVFNARLIITNALNCIDTSYSISVMTGNKPSPAFSVSPNPFCASSLVQFTDQTPPANQVNFWQYTVGGRSLQVIPMNANPLVKVHADTGKITATLLVGSNGCYASASTILTNNGPVDSIAYSVSCSNPLTYNFKAISVGSTSFLWNFGDNSTNSSSLTTTHTYATPGDYTVSFIGSNSGGSCTDTVTQVVKVRNNHGSFSSSARTCAGSTLTFIAAEASTDHECREKYIWNFGDGSSSIQSGGDTIYHTFLKRDTCKVNLISIFDNGCSDTVTNTIMVYQPFALFSPNISSGCTVLPVKFTDQSVPDVNTIKMWNWDYGDGDTYSSTFAGNTHTEYFSIVGTFKAVLTVIDTMNCVDTVSHLITTASPTADFFAPNGQVYCSKTPVQFLYSFPDPDSVYWTFGDGTTSKNVTNPITHSYMPVGADSTYSVSLIVYKNGCASPLVMEPNYITVQHANAMFQCDSVINCVTDQVVFTHLYPSPGMTGSWNFGDSTSSNSYITSPSHLYLKAGNYKVTLNIQSSAGCRDTFSRKITVKGPIGTFTISKINVCKYDTITARLKDTASVISYEWVLGDGRNLAGNPLVFSYSEVGPKNFSLGLNGNGGCNIVTPPKTIQVDTLIARFNLSDTVVCERTSVIFTNLSIGSNQQNWTLGDGTTSTLVVPSPHLYPSGNYNVLLEVGNTLGCKDTARHTMTVNPLPTLSIVLDKSLCKNRMLSIIAVTNGNSVSWSPSAGLNRTASDTVIASPAKTSNYKVTVTNTNTGCFNTDSINVFIPLVIISPLDTTIVLGNGVTIPVELKDSTGIGSFQWVPTTGLSCSNCLTPLITPSGILNRYMLIVQEPYGCFTDTIKLTIKVDSTHQAYALPKAFRPGSDGVNGYFTVRGRGIKQILEFKIYNRYGEVVYSSTDLSTGWDGTYNGQIQAMDTYIYTITVETYDGKISSGKGAVLLLR